MNASTVRLKRAGGVARITLNRPPLNVLNVAMMRELRGVLREVHDDVNVNVLLLTGAGRAFCAGVDVEDHTAGQVEEMLDVFHGVLGQLMDVPCPVVAAVNGVALGGGCELMLASDIVLAVEDATVGQPEVRLGVFPPVAAVLLPRLIGWQRALDLILSGRGVKAAEALGMGLVSQVFPKEEFGAGVDAYVEGLADLSGPVLRLSKATVRECLELSAREGLEIAERRYLQTLMALEDPHEGLAAFVEKRKPVWEGAAR